MPTPYQILCDAPAGVYLFAYPWMTTAAPAFNSLRDELMAQYGSLARAERAGWTTDIGNFAARFGWPFPTKTAHFIRLAHPQDTRRWLGTALTHIYAAHGVNQEELEHLCTLQQVEFTWLHDVQNTVVNLLEPRVVPRTSA